MELAARLRREVEALADALALTACELSDDGWWYRPSEGDRLRCGVRWRPELRVEVGPWVLVSEDLSADEGEEGEQESFDLCLDLLCAALFGHLRLVEQWRGERCVDWRLEFQRGKRWQKIAGPKRRPWVFWGRRVTTEKRNELERPERWRVFEMLDLPWAPWAGAGGYAQAQVEGEALAIPIDGELDLHHFRPKEVKPLVLAYIDECLARDIHQLRIVHGKGKGQLRRTVPSILDKHDRVKSFRLGGHGEGSWGATMVELVPGNRDARE